MKRQALAGAVLLVATALLTVMVPSASAHMCSGTLPSDCGSCTPAFVDHDHRIFLGVPWCRTVEGCSHLALGLYWCDENGETPQETLG